MGDAAHWPYGGGATGQPEEMQDGEYISPAPTRPLFGMRHAISAGVPKRIVVPQPAAGAEWLYKHSGPSWILLRSIVWQLATAVAVATRVSRLQYKFGTDLIGQFPPTATQAASLTVVYQSTTTMGSSADTATVLVGLPGELILGDNMSLRTSTTAMDAGDQYSAIAIFGEEFTDACWY